MFAGTSLVFCLGNVRSTSAHSGMRPYCKSSIGFFLNIYDYNNVLNVGRWGRGDVLTFIECSKGFLQPKQFENPWARP